MRGGGAARRRTKDVCAHGRGMGTVAGAASRAAMLWQGARGAAPKESGGKGRYLVVKLFVRCSGRPNKVCWQRF